MVAELNTKLSIILENYSCNDYYKKRIFRSGMLQRAKLSILLVNHTKEIGTVSLESVKNYFLEKKLGFQIIELGESTATVELAAKALGVEPARIAKTMAFRLKGKDILILSKGDARVDNRKYKDTFGEKAKMLKHEEVFEVTGHPVGGVCPFGLKTELAIYLDISLKEFQSVFPAAGSRNSAVQMTPEQLGDITCASWVDVCQVE